MDGHRERISTGIRRLSLPYRIVSIVFFLLLALGSSQILAGAALPVALPAYDLSASPLDVAAEGSSSTMPLAPGWDLVSLPYVPASTDPAVVLSSIASSYDLASTHRACDAVDPDKQYVPGAPGASDLTAIDHTMGLWIHMTKAGALQSSGPRPTHLNLPLCTGWNLIGWALPEQPVGVALSSIAGQYSRVLGYDPARPSDPWTIYDPAVPDWANDLRTMQRGRGYWVLTNVNTTLRKEVPGPTVTLNAPADGAEVTAPIAVQGTVVAPEGQSISSWAVTYQRGTLSATTGAAVTLRSGTGMPPANLANFDPTLLPNGPYLLSLTATADGGGSQTATATVNVAGKLKLGRVKTTYQDMDVPVEGLQMQVHRIYDSGDKEIGDFGIGWRLDLANFRVFPNRKLGLGGWTSTQVPCGFFFWCHEVSNTSARFVTVTHPDGRTELFDLNPEPGSGFMMNVTAAFVPREGTGTTSQLEVAGGNPTLLVGQGNLYTTFFGDLFDPRQFRLTTIEGNVLILDRDRGLISMTDRNGHSLQVTNGGVIASNGVSLTFTRDGEGRITQIVGPVAGQIVRYTYYPNGDLETYTDTEGNKITYFYDALHNLKRTDGPGGQPLRILQYNSDGRLEAITDGNGNTTKISYDISTRQEVVTDPTGQLTTISSFNDRGDIVQEDLVLAGKTLTTKWIVDDVGRMLQVTDPLGHSWKAAYDSAGNQIEFTDANGHTVRSTFNQYGQVTSVIAPDKTVMQASTFDERGNLLRRERGDGTAFVYAHDSSGRVTKITDPAGRSVGIEYDVRGFPNAIVEPGNKRTTMINDAAGRVTSVTNAAGDKMSYEYDGNSNLVVVTDPLGNRITYQYNFRQALVAETDRMGRQITYRYDDAGLPVSIIDRDNRTASFEYDANGRLKTRTLPGGDVTTFTYDPLGRLESATDSDSRVVLAYDGADRLISQSTSGTAASPQPAVTLNYEYDSQGNLVNIIGPEGTTVYGYDTLSRLTTVTDPQRGTFTLAYDPVSRLQSVLRPNGVRDVLTYDAGDILVGQTDYLGTGILARTDYTIDGQGRRIARTDLAGTSNYTYDDLGQLTAAAYPPSTFPAESYQYDDLGNRIASVGAPLGSYQYDREGRVLSDATYAYSYNNEGDLISRRELATGATTTYEWTASHQLLAVYSPSGATTRYRYDPFGRRIEVDASGQVTRYAYDGKSNNIQLEYDGANNLVASYTHGLSLDVLFGMRRGGSSYYYLRDALGSVTALADSGGAIAAAYRYNAFGQQQATAPIANPFSFTGREYEPGSGLYYYRARYYDPSAGRFLSEDPIRSPNPYSYAYNNPTNLTDPTGMSATTERSLQEEQNAVTIQEACRGKLGGIFRKLKTAGRDRHHLVAQMTGSKRPELAIRITPRQHRATGNWGYGSELGAEQAKLVSQGLWEEALMLGIWDMLDVAKKQGLQHQFEKAIEEALLCM